MDDAATMETTTTTGTTATVASGGKKQERKSAWPMISGEWVEWMMQREGGREGGTGEVGREDVSYWRKACVQGSVEQRWRQQSKAGRGGGQDCFLSNGSEMHTTPWKAPTCIPPYICTFADPSFPPFPSLSPSLPRTVDDALTLVLQHTHAALPVQVPLQDALGCVLAEDIVVRFSTSDSRFISYSYRFCPIDSSSPSLLLSQHSLPPSLPPPKKATEPQPPFPAAIMDGYAIHSSDGPGVFPVVGRLTAGIDPDAHGKSLLPSLPPSLPNSLPSSLPPSF